MSLSLPVFEEADGLIDGGYLTFVYGTRKGGNWGGWATSRANYAKHIVCMDGPGSLRRDLFPDYKIRRRLRRLKDPEAMEKYEMVTAFREIISQDPTITTVELNGYEADDLLGYLFINSIGCQEVISQDKDLLMIPGMLSVMANTSQEALSRKLKLPKYAKQPVYSCDYVLTQALFGDKSDSIPRLLSSHPTEAKHTYESGHKFSKRGDRFRHYYQVFGPELMRNINLVTIPHPSLTVIANDDMLILKSLCNGSYWRKEMYDSNILVQLKESIQAKLDEDW